MRILFVTNNLKGTDGASRYSKDVVREVVRAGHEVLCAVAELSESAGVEERVVLGPPLSLLANPWRVRRMARRLASVARGFGPDVIHFCVEPYALSLVFLRPSAQTFVTIHGTYAYMPLMLRGVKRYVNFLMSRRMYKKANHIVSVSRYTARHLRGHIGERFFSKHIARKTSVIHNGVTISSTQYSSGKDKKTSSIKNILFVGAVKPRKGLFEALRALVEYRAVSSSNDFVYYIVGLYDEQELYYRKLRSFIDAHGLSDNVVFVGRVSEGELEKYLADADLFLMLSQNDGRVFEGFGIAYLEANAHGVPTIGPNDSGAREAIHDSVSGYVVNPNDADEAAERIHKVIDSRAIDSENCIAWAKQHDIRKQVQKLLQTYKKVIRAQS